jgi:alanyl-tRNA synthetase
VIAPGFPAGLSPTRKLFHADPGATATTARVLATRGDLIILDRTIFYAESGGQVSDTGTIDAIPVLEVAKHGGNPVKIERSGLDPIYVNTGTFITHRVPSPDSFEVGQTVALEIDGSRRARISVHHTAAHFVFEVLRRYVLETSGEQLFTRSCMIDHEHCRFDLADDIPANAVAGLEAQVNALMADGGPIEMLPDTRCDDVYYWTYRDIVIPCGGTHVARSEDIGPVSLRRRSKGRSNTRITALLNGAAEPI